MLLYAIIVSVKQGGTYSSMVEWKKGGIGNERRKRVLKLWKKVYPNVPHHAAEILQQ